MPASRHLMRSEVAGVHDVGREALANFLERLLRGGPERGLRRAAILLGIGAMESRRFVARPAVIHHLAGGVRRSVHRGHGHEAGGGQTALEGTSRHHAAAPCLDKLPGIHSHPPLAPGEPQIQPRPREYARPSRADRCARVQHTAYVRSTSLPTDMAGPSGTFMPVAGSGPDRRSNTRERTTGPLPR